MGTFIKTFTKIFAFLSAISVFLILLSLVINFFPINQNNKYFVNSIGDENSPNKIAIIKLNGPILNEPSSNLDINLFSNIEIIYTTHIKKVLTELESEKIKGLIISINSPGGSVSASYNLYNLFNDFKNLYLDDMITDLYDLRMLGSSFESAQVLMYLINGSIRGISGYIKRLIDTIRITLKKNDLKASKTKIVLSWTLDANEMRGDKIEMLNTIASKLRDYIGDVET